MTTDNRAKEQAIAQLAGIREMVDTLNATRKNDGFNMEEFEEARDAILNDPLSLRLRSGWYAPGDDPEPEEFELLLSTGGPACRIIGKLNEHAEPELARIEYQDWGTPWTALDLAGGTDEDVLLAYCREFYYGE